MWIFAVISIILGLGCINYNQEQEVKHNFLLGFIGYIFAVPIISILKVIFDNIIYLKNNKPLLN